MVTCTHHLGQRSSTSPFDPQRPHPPLPWYIVRYDRAYTMLVDQKVYVLLLPTIIPAPPRSLFFCDDGTLFCSSLLFSPFVPIRSYADAVCGAFGGLLNTNSNGDTCCPASCGVCTFNDGCTAGTAFEECCPWKIRRDSEVCSGSGSAPCNLDGESSPAGQDCCMSRTSTTPTRFELM